MKTYKETIRREAFGVVASYMSGGYGGPERQVVHCIARIYEVSSSKVDADIRKLLESPKFMKEAKGSGCGY
jgi:hypothetical protein